MKTFKNLLYTFLFASTLVSCDSFLEVEPVNDVSDESTIYDEASANTALRGVYRQLASSSYYGENFVTLVYYPSGDIKCLTTGTILNLVNWDFRADNASLNSFWNAAYSTINRANHVIKKTPEVSDANFTAQERNQIIGEAKFIRALAYFDLVRTFGGVQIYLEPTDDLNTRLTVKRSSLDDTYRQVLNDLNDAETLLAENVNRIRATRNTVWALKSRLYLYDKKWELAAQYATKLIDKSNAYNLVYPYSAWFANNVSGTEESIFELQYSVQNPSTIRSQMQHPTNGGTYRYAPNDNFVNLLNDSAKGGGRKSLIGSVTQNATTLWFGNLYYRKQATDPTYIFRIAELYLIRAEARVQLKNIDGALSDLNKIRKRADLSDFSSDNYETILDAIDQERRYEFAFEAHRWFDLVRTGRYLTQIPALDPSIKVASYENLFPIPSTQLDLDKNLDPNPGY
jgi:hypothetical protein